MALDDVHQKWFKRIDVELGLLLKAFREVLEELGENELAGVLDWMDGPSPAESEATPPQRVVDRELQVLSIAFQILNLVEESAAVQARRFGEVKHGVLHEPGLWGHDLQQLKELGFTQEQIAEQLRQINVEVVLTAHPTEAKRPVVLKQHRELFEYLRILDTAAWTERERVAIRDDIKVLLERLWRTGEIYLHKPGVESELTHLLDYFHMIFPRVLPKLDARLRDSWRLVGFDPTLLREAAALPRLRFGDWVGGDRDGHPFVDSAVTRRTLQRLRRSAVDELRQQLTTLYEELSLSDMFQQPPEELLKAVAQYESLLGATAQEIVAENPREPWRQFVGMMTARLPQNGPEPTTYTTPQELEADLALLQRSLEAVGADRLAAHEVAPVQRTLEVFGFHTAALDIRQNSEYHEQALVEMLSAAGIEATDFPSWDEMRKREFLNDELQTLRPLTPRNGALGEKAAEILATYEVVATHIRNHGPKGIGAFIVSMTRDVSDLLVVYLLAREVGLLRTTEEGIVCSIQVVPLLETVEDLARGPATMRDFLKHPITQRSLHYHADGGRPVQQIMVGYSDSNKGSGILTSHWHLHRAQKQLADIGRNCGVDIQFFHGRGGTFSRGAGPTHRFLESLPHGSLSGNLRVTEQGESIAQKYGHEPTAVYNLELLMAGVTVTTLKHQMPPQESPQLEALGDTLSEYSAQAYQDLIASDGFLQFWSEATPIDALEQSFIGSRPARRTGRRTLEDLRAIPWVFSWIQSRYYLPSWYGLGAALEKLSETDAAAFKTLQENVRAWPFMRYVIYNAETSLASADPELMHLYASLVEDEQVRETYYQRILEEYRRTGSAIDRLFGAPRHERRPRMVKTLEMREQGLRFLHHRQIELLRTWRKLKADGADEAAANMLPSLLLSVNAIASGQRTTG